MFERFGSFFTRLPLAGLSSATSAVLGAVALVPALRALPFLELLLVIAPPALVLGAFASSSRFLVRGRAFAPSRRLGTLISLFAASLLGGGLFSAGVFCLWYASAGAEPRLHTALVLGPLGAAIYLAQSTFWATAAAETEVERAGRSELTALLRAREAELAALTARVNPHFLFNSLHSIAALTKKDPDGARRMAIDLGELLRSRFQGDPNRLVPLSEELDTVRRYLAIEHVRFGPRLEIREELALDLDEVQLPAWILQPLVENALKHGIARRAAAGWIGIRTRVEADTLIVEVENPLGDGSLPRRGAPSSGQGLGLVEARLEALYAGRAVLTTREDSTTFLASIRLPLSGPEAR